MPAGVQALSQVDGVRIHGHVPDLQPWLDGCRVSVAPLRYGAGVKGKVNQALGRLVRAPGHSARVLLHCRRFADEAYRSLLSTEYGDPQVLTDDEEFVRWSARS